jgi:glycosyltransferase involved in cell wall biosynthesis
MKFVTLFPDFRDVHVFKDVGMIPFFFSKIFKFESVIVTNDKKLANKKYDFLQFVFLKKFFGYTIHGIFYLFFNSKKISILNLYHLSRRSLIWILIYKTLNTHGKVYLKLDADEYIRTIFSKNKKLIDSIKVNFSFYVLKKTSLVSIENSTSFNYLKPIFLRNKVNLQFVPNGFYDNGDKTDTSLKEPIIVSVGRIGSNQKANHKLLNAFVEIYKKIPNWKLYFVGPTEGEFLLLLNNVYKSYPELKEKIIITGQIEDKEKLNHYYKKASIFCLTSLSEGFPLAALEAVRFGCYPILSKLDYSIDLTNQGKLGDLFTLNSESQLSRILLSRCIDFNNGLDRQKEIITNAYSKYYWPEIVKKINSFLI